VSGQSTSTDGRSTERYYPSSVQYMLDRYTYVEDEYGIITRPVSHPQTRPALTPGPQDIVPRPTAGTPAHRRRPLPLPQRDAQWAAAHAARERVPVRAGRADGRA
jgi:hypothetical protein